MHGADDRGQIRMRGHDKFWPSARCAQGRGGETSLSTSRTGENKFTVGDSHPV